jgi:peptide/nickel transport system permease protein
VQPAAAITAVVDAPAKRGPQPQIVAAVVIALIGLLAALAPVLPLADPNATSLSDSLANPSSDHLLGTDQLGRDVLARLIFAARVDLSLGALVVLQSFTIGSLLGLAAGYGSRWVDRIVMGICDTVLCVPTYVLLVAIVFAVGPGVKAIIIVFAVLGWVTYARLMRDQVRVVRSADFVHAATLAGKSSAAVVAHHVVPNVVRQSLVFAVADFVASTQTIMTIGYFGFGPSNRTPEWGSMLADAQPYIGERPLLIAAPGAILAIVGVCIAVLLRRGASTANFDLAGSVGRLFTGGRQR